MAFHDERFPVHIARGARGGPRRRTQVVELSSGREERNASWADSRREYDVGYGLRNADDLHEAVAFFEARNGRLYGFRFKDWSDYKSCLPSRMVDARDQFIGMGTGTATQFPLCKRYGSDTHGYWRMITRPVEGSVRVAIGEVEQFSGFAINPTTGVVTFATAPGAGLEIRAGFEFDVPVRFANDSIDVTLSIERTGSITSIPLIELRD